MIKILFVCTGNICRSPTAEGVFRHLARESGIECAFLLESAGTDSYHVGHAPDKRAVRIAAQHGVSLTAHKARAVQEKDYATFDYIFAMDGGHLYELQQRMPMDSKSRIELFLSAMNDENKTEVPDPWYGNEKDFEDVFGLIMQGSIALLAKIKTEHTL